MTDTPLEGQTRCHRCERIAVPAWEYCPSCGAVQEGGDLRRRLIAARTDLRELATAEGNAQRAGALRLAGDRVQEALEEIDDALSDDHHPRRGDEPRQEAD